jgi:NADH:ubiquinone oxidoreductase subunit H
MPALPPLATEAIHAFIVGFIVLNVIIGMVTYVTLLERKFAARMQSRIGPYRVGPHGLLQPIADALKLMMKEDVVPRQADRRVYNLAPIVFLVPCMLIFATLPFAPGLGVAVSSSSSRSPRWRSSACSWAAGARTTSTR